MAKKEKQYVRYSTIWNAVGSGLNNPGESKICKIGKHKVLLTRSDKLDRNGNPVHTASVLKRGGNLGGTHKSNGSATNVVSQALKNEGIATKYPKPKKR